MLERIKASPGRRFLRDIAVVALTAAVGFAASSYWVSPGKVFAGSHSVPRVLELSQGKAREELAAAGFRARLEGERSSESVPRGGVVWQDPPPGMILPENTVVELVLSAGPAPVTIPDVIGFALPSAEKVLAAAGIKVGRVDTVTGNSETGVVLATRPAPGNGRPRGTPVDLVVSGGRGGAP